ncbi:MAG TPA: hypothetical protein PK339_01710 [Flavitalea sp.]|nr:hypothetical protein [Flavitalea sp.]
MKTATLSIRKTAGYPFCLLFLKALAGRSNGFTISPLTSSMAKSWISAIAGIVLFAAAGRGQDCEALIRYRNVELKRQYDSAFDKYKVNKQTRMDIERMRYDLLKGDWYSYSTSFAASDAGLATALIAKNIQTTCNLILGLLKLAPGAQLGAEAAENTSLTATRIYDAIQAGKKLDAVVQEGAEKTAYREMLSLGNPLMKSVNIAWKFSEDVIKMTEMPKQQDELKREVKRILDLLQTDLAKYQQAIESSNARMKELQAIVDGISRYLSKYCPKKEEAKKAEKPAPAFQIEETAPAPAVAKNKPASNNVFYLFLSASITIGEKSVRVISSPVMHSGEFSDDMSDKKEKFIQDIARQLPNKPDRLQEKLRENNYQSISVHFSLPYSTEPLHGPQDVREAIDGFKRSIWQAVAGLSGSENIEFYQLR